MCRSWCPWVCDAGPLAAWLSPLGAVTVVAIDNLRSLAAFIHAGKGERGKYIGDAAPMSRGDDSVRVAVLAAWMGDGVEEELRLRGRL